MFGEDLLVAAQYAFVEQQQADQLFCDFAFFQRGAADEVAFGFQVDRPRQAGFQRRSGFVHVLAV